MKDEDSKSIKESLFEKSREIEVKIITEENLFNGLSAEQIEEIEHQSSATREDALSYDGEIIQEYDYVEIIEDNEQYNKQGVYKGMRGTIWFPIPYKGKWPVNFMFKDKSEGEVNILGNHIKIIKTIKNMKRK